MTLSRHTSHVYFFLCVGWRLLLLYFFFSNTWIAFLVQYFVNALKPPNAAAFPPAAKLIGPLLPSYFWLFWISFLSWEEQSYPCQTSVLADNTYSKITSNTQIYTYLKYLRELDMSGQWRHSCHELALITPLRLEHVGADYKRDKLPHFII